MTCIIHLDFCFKPTKVHNTEASSYDQWLPDWLNHLISGSRPVTIPMEACHIQTPLNKATWQYHLRDYPYQELVKFFLESVSNGFRIGYNGINLQSAKKNLTSATAHPDVVDKYLHHELLLRRMSGPYPTLACSDVHISRFGVIPKNHQPNKWRLITDLLHPAGSSINDGIPPALCSLSYVTIDDAIQKILQYGRGTMLAKIDIQSVFRLLLVHPEDRHLLAMSWKGELYIDHCIPFGLRSAPRLFNILADLLSWATQKAGVSYLIHYLDDYLTVGPPLSQVCQHNVDIFTSLCTDLGIPLATDNLEGPATSLRFLGIILDTNRMEIRLPAEKLSRTREMLKAWLSRKKATKREVLSLVGTLQHATKVVRLGKTFVSRMYLTAAKLKNLHFITRLNKAFRSDLFWWHIFLESWNGFCILRHPILLTIPDFLAQTDASGAWGCTAVLSSQWLQWQWPSEWSGVGIMAKELVPIIFTCVTWGPMLRHRHINFQCDNEGLVAAISKGSSKDTIVMHLLCSLWFFIAHFDITITATHLPGVMNTTADHLSRGKLTSARQSNPALSAQPTHLPPSISHIVSPQGLDWTSPQFLQLFQEILSSLQQT